MATTPATAKDKNEPAPAPTESTTAAQSTPEPLPAVLARVSRAVGAVAKGSQAPGSVGGYKFRGVDAVVNAVHPHLTAAGVVLIPEVLDVTREQTPRTGGGMMMNVVVRTRFTFYGPAGDALSLVTLGEASDVGDKASSKAQSVALRVALLQALLLPTDEQDPDETNYERADVRQHPQERQQQGRRSPRQQPQEHGEPGEVPAHVASLQADLEALTSEQQQWVRANWPQGLPGLNRLTVAGVARVREETLALVPPQ